VDGWLRLDGPGEGSTPRQAKQSSTCRVCALLRNVRKAAEHTQRVESAGDEKESGPFLGG
jgi:hypothetical protein